MRPAIIYCCLLFVLSFSNGAQAQVKSREIAKIPNLQMACAEAMIRHINDPADKARGLGLMAMDYLNYNDPNMAWITYDRFRQVCPKIADKNVRYRYLLKATNELSPILTELEKKTLFDRVLIDSVSLSIWNKITLAQLAANCGDYNGSYELISPIAHKGIQYNLENSGKLRWIYDRELEFSMGRILTRIADDSSSFGSSELKHQTLLKLVVLDPFTFDNFIDQTWVDESAMKALDVGDLDLAIMVNESRVFDSDKAEGFVKILDTLIARNEKDVAKQLVENYQKDIEAERIIYYLERFYLTTFLKLDQFETVIKHLNVETNPIRKCHFYNALADAYFQRNQAQLALNYLDSSTYIVANEVKDNYKIEQYLFIARTYQENKELKLAEEAVVMAQSFIKELSDGKFSKQRGLEQLVVHYAYNMDYESAILMSNKMTNSGSSSPRSNALEEAYEIAIYNGDMDAAKQLNDEAVRQLDLIDHKHQSNWYSSYTAVNYAEFGDYTRSFEVAQGFLSNDFHKILDFITGFKSAYEFNEDKQMPEAYYIKFLDLIEVDQSFRHNYYTYNYLIESYYNEFYEPSDFDFESEIIDRLKRYDIKEEFHSKRQYGRVNRILSGTNGFNRIDQLLSMDLILFQLYYNAGESEKLNVLVNEAVKQCEKRKYNIQDLEDLLDIESKYLRYGTRSIGLIF